MATIHGTPTVLGTYTFTVRATDANSFTGTQAYTVQIINAVGFSGAIRAGSKMGGLKFGIQQGLRK